MPAVVPFDTLPELFLGLSERYRGHDRAALRFKDRAAHTWLSITHDALSADVWAFAGFLRQRGIEHGDRVAILSENRPEWAVADLAIQLLGAVTVPLYATLPTEQVEAILDDAGARALVVSTRLQLRKAEALARRPALLVALNDPGERDGIPLTVWPDALREGQTADRAALLETARSVSPDDLSVLIYTSGTTGEPRGVMLTHRNVCSNAHAALAVLPVGEGDEHLSFLPLSHAFERTAGYTVPLAAGCTIAYAESVDAVAKNLPEVRPTLFVAVPRVFEKVYAAVHKSVEEDGLRRIVFEWALRVGHRRAERVRKRRFVGPILAAQSALAHRLVFRALHERLGGRLRFAVSGGAALPEHIGRFFEATGIRVLEGYGLTETAPVLTVNPVDAPRFGTVGRVLPGVTVAIRELGTERELGTLSGDGYPSALTTEAGEIVARGPNVFQGYWRNEAATRDAFTDDGWYCTGDVGRFEDGYLRITDRLKHMLVTRGGKNVYPAPIEETLGAHPLVAQVMVVGEARDYLAALIVPEMDALRELAREDVLDAVAGHDLLAEPSLRAHFDRLIQSQARHAASHERVRAFHLVAEPFTEENGLMTPTMKLRRRAIAERYAAEIDALYANE